MFRQIIELGSLTSGFRAVVVTEYDMLLLPFSFSEMTVAISHWRCIGSFGHVFSAIDFIEVKMPTKFPKYGNANFQVWFNNTQ